jgi:hypothetical protein
MTPADAYRSLAAILHDRARNEQNSSLQSEWVELAASYERWAEEADKNCSADVKRHPILGGDRPTCDPKVAR